MSKEKAPEDLVIPGDRLGVAEEFLPGPGTYEIEYQIRAATVGKVVRDLVNKVVSVKPYKSLAMPYPGAIVLAVVTEMREDFARTRILTVNNVPLNYPFTGILHVSQVIEKTGEIKQMYSYVRIGDIVKSKVLNSFPPYLLTIKDAKLGVVLASCSKCGAQLRLSKDKLKCPECGNIETRKLGHGYGNVCIEVSGTKASFER
ncbi:MAG: exosome complex RNA-binding protein Csl4 [Sulfolobales archaeon]